MAYHELILGHRAILCSIRPIGKIIKDSRNANKPGTEF